MKLYNRTECPDRILQPLLVAAGRAVGAKTGEVIVKVGQARLPQGTGIAIAADRVRLGFLQGKPPEKWGRWITTQGGYIRLTLPGCNRFADPLILAQSFYELAVHEWGHILDFQIGLGFLPWSGRDGERKPRWKERPEEIRACTYANEALRKEAIGQLVPRDDLILELAIWLEEKTSG
jgi:hypothetical protein